MRLILRLGRKLALSVTMDHLRIFDKRDCLQAPVGQGSRPSRRALLSLAGLAPSR